MITNRILWVYSGSNVGLIYIRVPVGTETSLTLSGTVFTVTRESSAMNNELSSSLTFITDSAMDGQSISCIGERGSVNVDIIRVRTDGKN